MPRPAPAHQIDGGCGLVEVPVTNSEKVFRILSRTLIYTCRTWRVELEDHGANDNPRHTAMTIIPVRYAPQVIHAIACGFVFENWRY